MTSPCTVIVNGIRSIERGRLRVAAAVFRASRSSPLLWPGAIVCRDDRRATLQLVAGVASASRRRHDAGVDVGMSGDPAVLKCHRDRVL